MYGKNIFNCVNAIPQEKSLVCKHSLIPQFKSTVFFFVVVVVRPQEVGEEFRSFSVLSLA